MKKGEGELCTFTILLKYKNIHYNICVHKMLVCRMFMYGVVITMMNKKQRLKKIFTQFLFFSYYATL